MALNSSGPISLAGTTVGQSIQEELDGNGTTQISLNDTNVRKLAGVVSGQITMPTNFWGKSNAVPVAFWFGNSTGGNSPITTNINSSKTNLPIQLISKESSLSYATNPTTNTALLLGRNLTNGNYTWSVAIGAATNYQFSNVTHKVVVDSVGNTYFLLSIFSLTIPGGNKLILVKVLPNGSIDFRKNITTSVATGMSASGFCIDASDNLYIFFLDGPSGYNLLKLASDGTTVLSIKRVLNTFIDCLAVDSDQNVYAFQSFAFVKWNPTQSAMLFRKQVLLNSPVFYSSVVAPDGSIFVTGQFLNTSTSNYQPFMAKLDSSGNTLWAKTFSVITNSSLLTMGTSVALDENGNSYFGGAVNVNSTSGTNTYVMKFASDGTLMWQRNLVTSSPTTNFSSFPSVSIGLTDPLSYSVTFLSGNPISNFNTVLLPQDGTKTGNLVSGGAYQYLASSYNVTNLSLTFSDQTLTTPTAGATMVITNDTTFTQITSYTGTPTNSLIP